MLKEFKVTYGTCGYYCVIKSESEDEVRKYYEGKYPDKEIQSITEWDKKAELRKFADGWRTSGYDTPGQYAHKLMTGEEPK